ncbi:MAG TPA: pyridoxal phosphate-dependent aminotransferase, partial [Atribacterota bacterium]|nr:pyridoxal phosphate-dependent aminotransferase [Atribacterota bacterium]
TETAFEVLAEVNKLKATGKDIISFAIGEPDFNTPSNIIRAGIKSLQEGYTHYGPSAGLLPFRESIARYVSRTRGIKVEPEEVVVTPGAKPMIFFSILACINEGDEVIYPNPGFPTYESVINFVGAQSIPLPLLEEKDFRFDVKILREKISERTRMIIINSPQNPTGGVLTEADLKEIASLAISNNIWVLSDEIYCHMVYDGNFRSIISLPGMKERTILLDGFSKTYAMTGWRLGFGVMDSELAAHFTRLATNSVSCTATFTQMAGLEGLEGSQKESQEMIREFKTRRDMIVELLNDIKGISCKKPAGAFYVYPNVTEACRKLKLKDSKELQHYLLYEAGVAVLARTCFGNKNQEETQEYIRLSYAASRENIREGLRRIKEAVEK